MARKSSGSNLSKLVDNYNKAQQRAQRANASVTVSRAKIEATGARIETDWKTGKETVVMAPRPKPTIKR